MRTVVFTILFVLVLSAPICLAQTYSKNANPIEENHLFLSVSDNDEAAAGASRDVLALHNRAVQNALNGHNREAIAGFRQVISEAPNLTIAHYNLAVSLARASQFAEAMRILRNLIAAKPDYAHAQAALGEVLCRAGFKEEGIEKLRFALKINFQDVVSTINLAGCLYETGQYGEALKFYENVINLKPDHPQAYNDRGVVLLALEKREQALNSFRQAIEKNPNFAESYNNLGIALELLGKKKEAHKAYLKAYELRPDWAYAVLNLAVSFLRLGDRPAAQKLLNELKKIDAELAAKLRDKLNEKYIYKAPI
jgi:tetratricopeptide (TPR) repeat protein